MHSKPVQTKPPVQPSVQAPRQVNDQTSMDTKPVQAQEVIGLRIRRRSSTCANSDCRPASNTLKA